MRTELNNAEKRITENVINEVNNTVVSTMTKVIDTKFERFAEQILEYTNSLRDTHERILGNHENIIIKLETHNNFK